MFNRVSSALLEPRLDADFYKKKFIDNEIKLKKIGSVYLRNLISTNNSGYGVLPKSSEYVYEGGVPLIRGGDLSYGQVVEPEVQAPISFKGKRATTAIGDVLILIKGACIDGPEGVAIVSDGQSDYIFNGSCYRLSFHNREVDGYYFLAFSQTTHFLKQKKRQVANTGISYNDESSIHHYLIPNFDAVAKKYIGDKVRQAERLRAWAKKVEAEVNGFHQQYIPDQSRLDFSRKTRIVTSARMTDRFDAHFYPGVVEDYLAIKGCVFKQVGEVASTVFNGQTQAETSGPVAVDQITVTHLSRNYVKGQPRRVSKPGGNDKFTKQHDLLICNAAHNKSYIGRDVTYYHSETPVLPSTEVMVMRVDRDQIPASYVRTYLLSRLGFVQIQSTIRGITAHSYPTDIKKLDVPIPEVSDALKHEWFACDEKMALAGDASEFASKLTSAAKTIVEALIEGVITEQQLIDANKALDADDASLDRDILARLTTKGLDGDGDPLFPDLEQLYDLLAQSQRLNE